MYNNKFSEGSIANPKELAAMASKWHWVEEPSFTGA